MMHSSGDCQHGSGEPLHLLFGNSTENRLGPRGQPALHGAMPRRSVRAVGFIFV
ncbi:hypothetical protein RLPCCGM1_c0029 [Rhizobium leguminosarum bv. phaseoli CCGM1]|nr:hypothetical protein RLPCCGM1_c0029 [Rhizobium leguminosarum bv. phaseoli CCGM1]